jgi:SAM-dependent methyltransferase
MFAMPGKFNYRECHNCGCLYLLNVPEDMSPYYPDRYYSKQKSRISLPRKIRTILYLSRFSFLVDWNPRRDLNALKLTNFNRNKSLLDVGSGSAAWLVHDLRGLGYKAIGVDPYITADVNDKFGVSTLKKSIFDMEGEYDIVYFGHSLEHMPNPRELIRKARSLLASDGVCIIGVPVVGWAWRHYGTDWAQLDPPRHICIYSEKGMDILAKSAGMAVTRVVYDSTDFQFWASEGLAKGILLPECPPPSPQDRRKLLQRAKDLNQKGIGDQAQFFLSPRPA